MSQRVRLESTSLFCEGFKNKMLIDMASCCESFHLSGENRSITNFAFLKSIFFIFCKIIRNDGLYNVWQFYLLLSFLSYGTLSCEKYSVLICLAPPLSFDQYWSNFSRLLGSLVLEYVYFMTIFTFIVPELWDFVW